MEVPEHGQTSRNLLILAGSSLPLFILLAAIGGGVVTLVILIKRKYRK